MVRMIRLPVLVFLATVGCATVPPTPPVATLLPDSPKEYRWSPFKWKPGVTLTYNEVYYRGIKVGGRQTDDRSIRRVFQMRGKERTGSGNVPVQLSNDGTDLGFLLVDEAGRWVDAIASRPEVGDQFNRQFKLRQLEEAALLKQMPEVLRVGESFSVELPSFIEPGLWRDDWPQEWKHSFKETIVIRYEFIGYARLGERTVVGLRGEVPNVLSSPLRGAGVLEINTLTTSEIRYFDAVLGFPVSRYSETSVVGEMISRPDARLPYVRRAVRTWELDWQKSSGF